MGEHVYIVQFWADDIPAVIVFAGTNFITADLQFQKYCQGFADKTQWTKGELLAFHNNAVPMIGKIVKTWEKAL